MGLPNNFSKQAPQRERRWEALNELRYYTVEYDVVITPEYYEVMMEDEASEWECKQLLSIMKPKDFVTTSMISKSHLLYDCSKSFSALDEEKARNQFDGWVEGLKEQGIITELTIHEFNENTLMEELDRVDALPVLKFNTKHD